MYNLTKTYNPNLTRIKPESNVKYTFVFKGGNAYTLAYKGIHKNGRYIFYNYKTHLCTTMTQGWFARLYKTQLISEEKFSEAVPEPEIKVKKPLTQEEKILSDLKSANYVEKAEMSFVIGYNVERLIIALEQFFTTDKEFNQDYINSTCGDMMKALDVLNCRKKLAN